MYFQIDPPGSDYTRVQLDVPNGQLEQVIRAVTTAEAKHAGPSTTASRDTSCCEWCGREVTFKDYRSWHSGVTAVDASTGETKVACRRCWAERDDVVRVSKAAGRWSGPGDVVRGNPAAVVETKEPAWAPRVSEHVGDELGHGGVVGPAARDRAMADDGEVGGAEQESRELRVVVLQLHVDEDPALGGRQLADDGEQSDEVGGRLVVDVDAAEAAGGGEVQGRCGASVHGVSLGACRCAGAARPDGAGEAEPTKSEALLEEAVELLKSIALSVKTPAIRLPENAAFVGRVKPEEPPRGVWSTPAEDMRVSFTGTTLADEDACRRVDDVDQDGPDCEGPEGGEPA